VIDEGLGVFVSPDGDDDAGDGTRASPYETLEKAVQEAAARDLRVYACADGGQFRESVVLGPAASGLEMYGGFSCVDWSYLAQARSFVRSEGVPTLEVQGVEGLRVEDFEFEAANATEAGGSSLGALVVESTEVVLRRVRLEAGTGMAGVDGMTMVFEWPVGFDGLDADIEQGPDARTCTCPDGSMTIGGEGGDGLISRGEEGGPGAPDLPGPGGEGGDVNVVCDGGGNGAPGANASAAPTALGAAALGTLTKYGWTPAAGQNGMNGSPAQGGGGGSSTPDQGGGGGGCGGCGGAGGPGGQGGGASIALAVVQSEVTVEASELVATDAGDAGDGGSAQEGMDGGVGGIGPLLACEGGTGGRGGKGGAGGGGAGGISVGVLWSGSEPILLENEYSIGDPGAKGIGGEPGVNDGAEGVAVEVRKV
jgi:hypothetical protein